ncbi:FAD-dependent oxidoreductase [Sorangium sp. So ce119]|uniref:NAD(P)/FAD-dependent oxidoreductase n=1 Tax=Sorangium sp. So ce119 TaxID=3133279 RepID=UPI003F5E7F7E
MRSLEDIVVIGGGAAGAAAAILLAQAGRRVVVLERSSEPAPHLPETYLGLRPELVQRLGIEDVIRRSLGAPPSISYRRLGAPAVFRIDLTVEAAAGGDGLTLDRTTFDALLLDRAAAAGAEIRRGATVESVTFEADATAIVRYAAGGTTAEHRASAVIDASGKTGVLRKALSLPVRTRKLDDRVAVFSHFTGGHLEQLVHPAGMSVAGFEDGYLLVAPMRSRTSVIAVVGEAAAERAGRAPARVFEAAVARWPALKDAIAASRPCLPVIPALNESIECERLAGPGFLLAGDAAAFIDPFFCPGLSTALGMGELAADVLSAGGGLLGEAYERGAAALLSQKRAAAFRWLDGPEGEGAARAFADPHMPWIVPAFFLGLFAGAGARWAPPAASGVERVSRAARDLYATL